MNKEGIKQAIFAATRFIDVATELLRAQNDHDTHHPKESGATRRSSLDLTRKLADMRRPG